MGQVVHVPGPALAPHVRRLVGYHHTMDAAAVHHGMPSPSATVIIAFDQPLDTAWLAAPATRDRFWTLASGLHAEPALIHTHGLQHGIQLDLTPAGVRSVLGLPLGAIAGTLVHHADLPHGVDES